MKELIEQLNALKAILRKNPEAIKTVGPEISQITERLKAEFGDLVLPDRQLATGCMRHCISHCYHQYK